MDGQSYGLKRGATAKTTTSVSSSAKSSAKRGFLFRMMPEERISLFLSNLTPDDSAFSRLTSFIFFILCFYFTLVCAFPNEMEFSSGLGTISEIVYFLMVNLPFGLGFDVFVKESVKNLTAYQIFFGTILAFQVVLLLLLVFGVSNRKLVKSENYKKFFKIILLICFALTPSSFNALGVFVKCNFYQIYDPTLPSMMNLHFESESCFPVELLIFQILGLSLVVPVLIVVAFVGSYAFLPLNQALFEAMFSQFTVFKVVIIISLEFPIMILVPKFLIWLGYLSSFILCSLTFAIFFLEHPFSSWYQGSFIMAFVVFRGSWSFLLFAYELFYTLSMSILNPFDNFKSVYAQYLDIIGGIVFLSTMILALIIAIITFVVVSLLYIRIAVKFRKLLKRAKIENEEQQQREINNEEGNVDALEQQDNEEERGGGSQREKTPKKKKSGKTANKFFCLQFLSSSVSDHEFIQGIKLACEDREVDAQVLESLIQERVLEDSKKEKSTEVVFSLLIYLLTRRKMEKTKKVDTQPVLGELLTLLFKKLEGGNLSMISNLRIMTIRNYLFSIHEKNAVDYEIKSTLERTQKLEGQYWALSEAFWKQVLDCQSANTRKAKTNLLILAKKIKKKKSKIKDLYEYLLACFPKDPMTLRLYGKYLNNIEKNPEATYYLQKAHDIEEQKIRQKRKKIFQGKKKIGIKNSADFSMKLDRLNTMTTDLSSGGEGGENSETSSQSGTEDKGKQDRAVITAAILRKKTEYTAKILVFLILATFVVCPVSYIIYCFYTLIANAGQLQENSWMTYKTCRLPGDIYYTLLTMRYFEKDNLTTEGKAPLFAIFDRMRDDVSQAFSKTKDVGNQKAIWEASVPMTFINYYPIQNFTSDWNNDLIARGRSTVTLSSMSNALVNMMSSFEQQNHTMQAQASRNLVPYLDKFNCILERDFVSFYENGDGAAEAYDSLCDQVFQFDVNTSSVYEQILVGIFVLLLLIPVPLTVMFVAIWILLLRKQSKVLNLFPMLPKQVASEAYTTIKKKKNHEQTKEFASGYELRLIGCYLLIGIFFFVTLILAFVATIWCLLDALNNLNAIKDASGTTYRLLQMRFLIGEFSKRYSTYYPLDTIISDELFFKEWAATKADFYFHWNNYRFGFGYVGLEGRGLDAKILASSFSKLIVTSETIQQFVAAGQNGNYSMDFVKTQVKTLWSSIENEHKVALGQLLSFLPYLMQQTSSTYIAILGVIIVIFPPFLAFFAYILMNLVFEYENDNYELLQQFNRIAPESISTVPAIKAYVFESSLAEIDKTSSIFFKFFKCCTCFKRIFVKRSNTQVEVISTKLFEEIYQTCPTAVIVCAQNGSISFINLPAIRIFEFEGTTDAVGINASRLFSVNSRLIVSGFFKSLQKNTDSLGRRKTILVKEEKIIGRRKNGQEFPCILSVAVNTFRGQMMVPLFINDITNEEQHEKLIQQEKAKSEKLLLNILPAAVAKRLGEGDQLISESFPDVTCFFSDIVGFTNMSSKITAWELIKILNDIVNGFDDVADKLQVEKIKTIGDAYFAVSGLHFNKNDHAQKMMLFAINARQVLNNVNRDALPTSIRQQDPKFVGIQIRIGIHTGAVVGGVIGKSKFQYDVWGSTVNLASRMESTGYPGRIQISRQTFERVHQDYKFEERDGVYAKGVGEIKTYILDDSEIPMEAFEYSNDIEFTRAENEPEPTANDGTDQNDENNYGGKENNNNNNNYGGDSPTPSGPIDF